jgi:hypothetical protein
MSTHRTLNPTSYPITRRMTPMSIGKRVTLAAVGTLGVAAALGLGGTIQTVAAPSSVPGSAVIALGPCFGPHHEPIPCPGPGQTVDPREGGVGGGGTGGAGGNGSIQEGNDPGGYGGGDYCHPVSDETACHQPD